MKSYIELEDIQTILNDRVMNRHSRSMQKFMLENGLRDKDMDVEHPSEALLAALNLRCAAPVFERIVE